MKNVQYDRIFLILLAAGALGVSACSEVVESGDAPFDFEILEPGQEGDGTIDGTEGPTDALQESDGACGPGETLCGGLCVNFQTDVDNCGACGHPCAEGEVCSEGVCSSECAAGLTDCSGSCVDTSTDPAHCGSCDDACPTPPNAVPTCAGGECSFDCEPGWSDITDAPGCETECTFVSPTEVCNGVDDNCNGTIDEGFDCSMGRSTSCTTPCGSIGTGVCGLDCRYPEPSACRAPAETCNGVDEDCDGTADNGFACPRGTEVDCLTACGTDGRGICTSACEIPSGSACAAGPEVCNGLDDNCNGAPDDTFPCVMGAPASCTTSCGSAGTGTCSATCTLPTAATCTPPPETCNGIDDDCDGTCDNGQACCRGTTGSCSTSCGTTGTRTCSSSCTWGTCMGPAETCNGTDDDCDGACDEDFGCCRNTTGSCTTSCGSSGTRTCSSSCTWGTCTPPAETCNGLDDNCNGTCDDGYDCCRGTTGGCTTSCGTSGTRLCSSSCTWGTCTGPAETCNGIDDDCDGSCDEDFACCVGRTQSCTTGYCTGTQTCQSGCVWGTCTVGTVPSNDTCAGAINVGSGGTFSGTTCGASSETSSGCGGSGPDVYYTMTLSSRSDVSINTCSGTSFDSVLHIRSGGCPGTEVVCNDDGCGVQSTITTTLDAGTYTIVVDSFGSTTGPFSLSVTITPSGPPNDTCSAPTALTVGTAVTGTTVGANHNYTGSCGGSGPDIVYRFTLGSTSDFFAAVVATSSWDPVVYISTTCGSSSYCNDDWGGGGLSSALEVDGLPAGTYYLVVDGLGSSSGTFILETYSHGNWVTGDGCADAKRLYNGVSGNTGAQWNDYTPSCRSSDSYDEVFYFIVESSRTVTVTTCSTASWDTVLFMRDDCDTGGDIACNDDGCGLQSSITGSSLAPGAYFVFVDGYSGSYGSYTLNVTGL
jgi:hypothetical protein